MPHTLTVRGEWLSPLGISEVLIDGHPFQVADLKVDLGSGHLSRVTMTMDMVLDIQVPEIAEAVKVMRFGE